MRAIMLMQLVAIGAYAVAYGKDIQTASRLSDGELQSAVAGDPVYGYVEEDLIETCEDCYKPSGSGVWIMCLGDSTVSSYCVEDAEYETCCEDQTYACAGLSWFYNGPTCDWDNDRITQLGAFACYPEMHLISVGVEVTCP